MPGRRPSPCLPSRGDIANLCNQALVPGVDDRDVSGAVGHLADDFRQRPALAKGLGPASELPNTAGARLAGWKLAVRQGWVRPGAPGPCRTIGCDTLRNHYAYNSSPNLWFDYQTFDRSFVQPGNVKNAAPTHFQTTSGFQRSRLSRPGALYIPFSATSSLKC
jgi:hypothetical protein